jgi:hypothetical protein
MVRFLHAFKKVKILFSDLRIVAPFIRLILEEFATFTNESNIVK